MYTANWLLTICFFRSVYSLLLVIFGWVNALLSFTAGQDTLFQGWSKTYDEIIHQNMVTSRFIRLTPQTLKEALNAQVGKLSSCTLWFRLRSSKNESIIFIQSSFLPNSVWKSHCVLFLTHNFLFYFLRTYGVKWTEWTRRGKGEGEVKNHYLLLFVRTLMTENPMKEVADWREKGALLAVLVVKVVF